MKQLPVRTRILNSAYVTGVAIAFLFATGCTKTAGLPQIVEESTDKTTASVSPATDIAAAFSPYYVLGTYSNRGSRTKYRGQANDNGDNIILSLDYINDKKVEPSPDKKTLTCGYGETNYVNQGWKYIIHYNAAKKEITLSPNDTMAAAIQPNSFESLYASYDPVYQSFTFQTRFTDKDGNENEVVDVMGKE